MKAKKETEVMEKNLSTEVPVMGPAEISELGLMHPGDWAETLNEVNGRPIGSKVEIISVENGGQIYRAKFMIGEPQVIRVLTSVLKFVQKPRELRR